MANINNNNKEQMADIDFSQLCLNPNEIDLVIYHSPCSDGFASAFSAWQYFSKTEGKNINGNVVQYYPTQYNSKLPQVLNLNVLICDFSYKKDIMKTIMSQAKKVIILDHHKSAEAELIDIPNENKIFRMDHSGAYITWKYFNRIDDVPLMILYIEDNDIWIKKMQFTKEVSAYIYSLPFDFNEYGKLIDPLYILNTAVPLGSGMIIQNETFIKQALSNCSLKFILFDTQYYFVVYNNFTVLKSEIGNECIKKYVNANFSAIYSIYNNTYSISLRSLDDRTDVSLIAVKLGGGGHRNASAISSKIQIIGTEIDDYQLYSALNNIYFDKLCIDDCFYNIVYLNYNNNKMHVSKYLLQTRIIVGKNIQECNAIKKNIYSDSSDIDNVCHISAVWHYDGKNNKTYMTLSCIQSLQILNKLKNKYTQDCYLTDNNLVFSISGLVNKL
jgi:oligoribonuclease NrnB/cAMP/cGMP phosphodiesterase (DHH superfamily)